MMLNLIVQPAEQEICNRMRLNIARGKNLAAQKIFTTFPTHGWHPLMVGSKHTPQKDAPGKLMHENDWYSPPLQQGKEQAKVENIMDANEKGFHCTRLEAVLQHEFHA